MRTTARHTIHRPTLALLPLALAAAFAAQNSSASGFQLRENSAQALGRAFAGTASAPDDASVVVNNPAAMSEFKSYTVQGDVTAIDFSTKFHGTATSLNGPTTGSDGGNGGTTKGVPAAFFILPVNEQFHLGAAFSVPFGFQTEYDRNWVGRYQAVKSDLQSLAATLSASYAFNDAFSIGGSFVAQRTSAELTSAVDFGTVLAANPALPPGTFVPQGADGLARVKGDDWGYGWQAGLLFKPTDSDRIGFNYHSKISHTIEGHSTYVVPAPVAGVFQAGGITRFSNSAATADLDTPATATVSWWHTLNPQWSFGADVSATRWSSLKNLTVRHGNGSPDTTESFNWDNSVFASIGAEYKLDNVWTLRGGVGVDGTPTHADTRSPRVPDGTRRLVAVGVGFNPSEALAFNVGYSHLFVNDGHVADVSPTRNALNGVFESKGNLLGVSGQYRF